MIQKLMQFHEIWKRKLGFVSFRFFVALQFILASCSSVMGQTECETTDTVNLTVPMYATDSIPADSIGSDRVGRYYEPRRFGRAVDRITSSRGWRMAYVGVPLIVGGVLVKDEDDHFRSLRNSYMPHFRRTLDNYTQFAPMAVMFGLKSFGVPSRSSWGRMIASDALSAALMAGVVNGLKYSAKVTRPDGSNRRSFPSGHTATAFMTATMLTKEYGYLSPWVGIGSYTIATGTGLMRMANNKHWLSDVICGAGIGILTTEAGYWLTDSSWAERA